MDKQDVDLGALYRDTVMDHYRSPRGQKALDRVDLTRTGHNPICGDKITLSVKLSKDGIEDVAVECRGCAISVASASMLAELLPGKTTEEIEKVAEAFRLMMHGQPPPVDLDLGDLDALSGVQQFPVRIKCALLAWMTMLDALRETGDSATTTEADIEVAYAGH